MANESDYPAKYQLENGSGSYLLETGTDYCIKETQNYFELILNDGANGFWPLGEASSASPAKDYAGGNNGTYVGSPTMGVAGPLVGDSATAVTLASGTSDEVSITGSDIYSGAATGSLTLEAWVNLGATDTGGDIFALNGGGNWVWTVSPNGAFTYIQSSYSATNTTNGALFLGGGSNLLNNARYVVFPGWNYLAIVVDGSATTGTAWINGSNAVSSGISGPIPVQSTNGTPKAWTTGALEISRGSFIGTVACCATYPTALTEAQLARHYRCGLQFLPDIPPPVQLAAH